MDVTLGCRSLGRWRLRSDPLRSGGRRGHQMGEPQTPLDASLAAQKQLSSRLYSYGHAPPRSLVARQRAGAAPLDPLPPPQRPPGPPLRKRGLPPDAALSNAINAAATTDGSTPFVDMMASFAGSGRSRAALHDPSLASSGPLPYAKLARSADQLVMHHPSSDPTTPAPAGRAVAPATTQRSPTDTEGEAEAPPAEPDEGDQRRDPFWFIKMLRTELSDHEFAYMNVADTDGTTWDPYNLKIVPFSEVNPNDHYTISEAGVTHCTRRGKEESAEFTPLEQWETECALFQDVMEIPFFKRYQSWKAYYSWKRAIQSEKVHNCKAVLTRNLFILNGTFQPSLLRVRELCVEISQLKLHQIKRGSTYTLSRFHEVQKEHKARR